MEHKNKERVSKLFKKVKQTQSGAPVLLSKAQQNYVESIIIM